MITNTKKLVDPETNYVVTLSVTHIRAFCAVPATEAFIQVPGGGEEEFYRAVEEFNRKHEPPPKYGRSILDWMMGNPPHLKTQPLPFELPKLDSNRRFRLSCDTIGGLANLDYHLAALEEMKKITIRPAIFQAACSL